MRPAEYEEGGQPVVSFPFENIAEMIQNLSDCFNQEITCRKAKAVCNRMIRIILGGPATRRSMDERIHRLLTDLDTFGRKSSLCC